MAAARQPRLARIPGSDWLLARWAALGAREQRGVGVAALVLAVALLWWLTCAPALRTLRNAPAQSAQLAATLERMQAMQARAQRLQAQPPVSALDMQRTLQSATAALGKEASLQVAGEQVTVRIQGVSGLGLATWLASLAGRGLSPSEASLQRDADSQQARWSGSLVFPLPPQAASAARPSPGP